jgi:coproporphyrinogen III oxidase-like Fe-S oxidoreductase
MKRSISRRSTKSRWRPTPRPSTWQKARLFRELGVTRVSLGIQSFAPHVLETLGREHTAEQASESVAILREAGIRR